MIPRPSTVLRDAGIVYGLTFATGIGMALIGVTLQNNASTTYLGNLLSGTLGFLISGVRAGAHRIEHLAWVAATVWTCNLLNIILGLQTTTSWIQSGLTVILMAALGGTLSMLLTLAPAFDRQR